MKQKILLLLLLAGIFFNAAKANESEPNDSKAQANTLALNGNNSGAINPAGDQDWWAVTTTGDGKLSITLTPLSGKYMYIYIYDNNGTTLLNSNSSNSQFTVSADGLATGTYYVKIITYYSGDTSSYTISSSLTVPSQANDAEPNDIKTQAKVLSLNSSKTGHVNYYYNGLRDSADWYKITTNTDGRLRLRLTSGNNEFVWAYLYDNDGTTQLAANSTNGTVDINADGLAAGTYFVRINSYYDYKNNNYTNNHFETYTLADSLFTTGITNDAEPDDSMQIANTLALNGSTTGHVNYYFNHKRDASDWYKVTTNADGRLRLKLTSGNGEYVWAYLYDNDGTTQLAANNTNTSVDISADGLEPGTYYIRINSYYDYGNNAYTGNHFETYTLADSLFTTGITNDAEPNDSMQIANTLALNDSTTGHVNYYYNHKRDAADWYKITTNADGRLRLRLTSHNGDYVWAYLYDNDGITQLNSGNTNGTTDISSDGLAAGTYYIRINSYYDYGNNNYTNNHFETYTLSDSLFKPAEANDTEPNDSVPIANKLAVNSNTTGHINYYYNHKRDAADWYKITLPQDGMLRLRITSGNGDYVWAYLFDHDGTTQLNSGNANGTTDISTDGLAAGTYYVRVNSYYDYGNNGYTGNHFEPYTLADSLFTYTNTVDFEPNNYFKQAKTMPSNRTSTGHVNFYYNGSTDPVDYHKINYTGTGNLTLNFNQENRIKYGNVTYAWFQVYKDTASAPIYSGNFNGPSGDINFTNLAQGYYFIKVYTYYNGAMQEFSSYSITNTYTQVNIATITMTGYTNTGSCDSSNSITYKLAKSHSPYRVQLFRFDSAYGSVVTTSKKQITFDNLPPGIYYATVYGDGATGTAFGKSKKVILEPTPQNPSTTQIKSTKSTLNWDMIDCADYFTIQYKLHSGTNWKTKFTSGNVDSYVLTNLTANTQYDWAVAVTDSANGVTVTGPYSDTVTFTTAASLIADANNTAEDLSVKTSRTNGTILITPNPAASFFIIYYNSNKQEKVNAQLFDVNGKAIWSSGLISNDALNGRQVNVNEFAKGIYYLKVVNESGAETGSAKIVVAK